MSQVKSKKASSDSVSIAHLRSNLTSYIKQAKAGKPVLICNFNQPVALLTPIPVQNRLAFQPATKPLQSILAMASEPTVNLGFSALAVLLKERDEE